MTSLTRDIACGLDVLVLVDVEDELQSVASAKLRGLVQRTTAVPEAVEDVAVAMVTVVERREVAGGRVKALRTKV